MIYGQEDRLLPWASERTGDIYRRDAYTIGVARDGKIMGVAVFDNFSEADCNMHIASDGSARWMTKEALAAAFAYPFIQLGLRRVTGVVPAKNIRALAFDEHIGFVREGYHPNARADDDLITLGLLRENCRFLPHRFDKMKG